MQRVTPEQARNCLMAFKRNNFAVDPDNKEHLEKYQKMRMTCARVSPAMFMKFLDTGKEVTSAGTKSSILYWCVPKANFPKGLPAKLKAGEVAAEEDNAPPDVDREEFYVLDQCIPRDQLGKNVWTVSVFSGTASKFQSSGPSSSREDRVPATGGGAVAVAATGDAPQAEDSALVAAAPRGAKRSVRT